MQLFPHLHKMKTFVAFNSSHVLLYLLTLIVEMFVVHKLWKLI